MPHRQLFCAADRCGKTYRLATGVRALLAAGTPADQMLALTVYQPAANVLRQTLIDTARHVVPTTTVRRRALGILAQFPAEVGLPPGWEQSALLSGIDRRLLIRAAWAAAGDDPRSLYAQRGDWPGALDWIARLFDSFSEWAGTADFVQLPALTITEPHLAELWRAYCGYLSLCRRHGVVAFTEVFNRAIDALRQPAVQNAMRPPVLLLDDLDLFRTGELLFVSALLTPGASVYASASQPFDSASPVALERFIAGWIERHALQAEPCGIDPLAQPLLSVGEYASPDAEAHAIAQRIAAATATTERYDECAIVCFDAELEALLQRILPRYGLPVAGQAARNGYSLALAPLALAGLKLLAAQPLTSAETIALLRHPALALSSSDAHRIVEALDRLHFQALDATDTRWPSGLSAAGRARLETVREVTRTVRASGARPSAQLNAWLTRLDLAAQASQQTEQALEAWAVTLDQQHWTRWLGFLQQSETLREALGAPLSLAEAVDVFAAAQALIEATGQFRTNEVQMWSPEALGGCATRYVFAAGLHEAALPQAVPPLPFGDDQRLSAAFGALPGFVAPQINDQEAAWARGQRQLQRVIGRAQGAAHLSYSRTDRQERRRLPSPVLADRIGAQIGRHGQLEATARSSIETVPLAEHDPAWLDLAARPLSYAGAHFVPPPAPVPGTATGESPLHVSPSAIEDYFTCPRRCYYARHLGLYDVSSSPRQALGMVVHNALNDLLLEGGAAPDAARAGMLIERYWIDDPARWGSRLKQTIFRQLAERAVVNLARYQAEQSRTIFLGGELRFHWTLSDQTAVIHGRIDRIDRTAAGLDVVDYKLGQESPSINALLTEFIPPSDQEPDWRPGDIQLPVYALAIERGEVEGVTLEPGERVCRVALVYPLALYSETGKLSVKGRREIEIIDHQPDCRACEAPPPSRPKVGLICRSQLDALEQRVHAAIEAMRAGDWRADPREGSRTCGDCNFRPICSEPQ